MKDIIKHYIMSENKDRENYTRITTILYPFSGLDKIDSEIVSRAADRGTKIHKICEAIASGLGEYGVDDQVWGYVESFKKWWGTGRDIAVMEERFWDDEFRVTGQVDFILNTDKGLAVVDLKTSYKESKTWSAQGAAYAWLAKNNHYDIRKIYFIHLNKHGKEPRIYEYSVDDQLFMSIWKVYNHFFKEEK